MSRLTAFFSRLKSLIPNHVSPLNTTADEQQQTEKQPSAGPEQETAEKASSEERRSEEIPASEEAFEDAASEEGPAEEAAVPSDGSEEEVTQEAPPSEVDVLRAELREREEERDALNDRLLRTAAEMQNMRRRSAKEQRRRAAAAKAGAVRPMLDVMDDLERTLAAADDIHEQQDAEAAFQSLRDGIEMVAENFRRALASQGVEAIDAEGQPFDENEHEAMMQQPAPEGVAPGTVLGEIRTGYRMDDDRILRHSRVVVASERGEADAGENAEE